MLPTKCPNCSGELTFKGLDLVCANPDCGNRTEKDLMYWMSYIGDVEEIGSKLKAQWLEENEIDSLTELYSRSRDSFMFKDSVTGQKLAQMADKLFIAPLDVYLVIFSLNIPRLGWTTVKKINWTKENIELLSKGVVSKSLESQFTNSVLNSVKQEIKKFEILGNILTRLQYPSDETAVTQKGKVAITGALSMKRKDFEKLLIENGWELAGISKDTKYLITDNPNSGSSKSQAANRLGVRKITEEEFMKVI